MCVRTQYVDLGQENASDCMKITRKVAT